MRGPKTHSVTAREAIAAIEKNGYEQAFHNLYDLRGSKLKACAIGQMFINLGIFDPTIKQYVGRIAFTDLGQGFQAATVSMNDYNHFSLVRIAEELKITYAKVLDRNILEVTK